MEPRLSPCPREELDAVDVVAAALAVDSLGFNVLVSDSILVATAPVTWAWPCRNLTVILIYFSCRGYMPCSKNGRKTTDDHVVITNREERRETSYFRWYLFIKLAVHTVHDWSCVFCCSFNLFWFFFCGGGGSFPQFLACPSMPSFFPMVYLALTTAILRRVA